MSLDGPYGSKLKLRVVEDTVKNNIFQDVPLPANTNIRVVKWARNQIVNPLPKSNCVSCEIVFFTIAIFSQSFLQPWLEHIPLQQPCFTFSLGVSDTVIVMMMSGDTFLICLRFLYLPQLFID